MSVFGEDAVGHPVALPDGGELVLSWASRTDVGHRRQVNEDSVVARPPVFAVADGMGGHAAGDRASAAVAERLAALGGDGVLEVGLLDDALAAAAEDIDRLAEGIAVGAGTTVTGAAVVHLDGRTGFAVFNIGDSRVYCFERDELVRVTIDHSVVQELVDAGLLDPAEAEHHPESNVVTRALGFRAAPEPDAWTLPARPGMRFLLCSDGLTKEVDDDGILRRLAAGEPAADTADALMDDALAAGGRDNVSLIVLDVVAVG